MRRLAILAVALLGVVPAAEALTIRDVIELSRAGLGEQVLLAMIEVDGGVYQIDTAALKSLKEAGVPERVIVALVKSGRQRPIPESAPVTPAAGAPAQPDPQPQVVVIDHHQPAAREVMVPVPIYIPVDSSRVRRHRSVPDASIESTTFVPFQSGPPLHRQTVPKAEPVYWGFGGKLRPDAWQPDNHKRRGHETDGQESAPPRRPERR